MSTVKLPENPEIFDKALAAYNTKLKTYFPWLQHAYGIGQRLQVKNDQGRVVRFPGIYSGTGKDYLNLFPAERLGNFSWWELSPYKVEQISNQQEKISADFGLVVWFNLVKVLGQPNERRNLEMIKGEFLAYFRQVRVPETRITVGQITTREEDLYKGYSLQEVEEQYLMHPFAGVRFNGTITVERLCQ